MFELSNAQQRIYVLEKINALPFLYHVPVVIQHNLNADTLRSFLQTLTHKHKILTACIRNEAMIFESVEVRIEKFVIDAFDSHIHPQHALYDFFTQPFNLEKAPLFRTALIETSTESYIAFCFHHILVDGWSMQIFLNELENLYLNRPALTTVDYEMYVEEEKLKWTNVHAETYFAYWDKRLANAAWRVELPTDHINYDSQHGENAVFTLSETLLMQCQACAQQLEISLNQFLLAIWSIVLSRFSNQSNILIGIPTANRYQQKWFNTIGLFVNTLLFAQRIDINAAFSHFAQHTQKQFFEDLMYAELPYNLLINHLYQTKVCQPGLQFNTLFNFTENKSHLATQLCLLPASKFELSLHIFQNPQHLQFIYEYQTHLFKSETIQIMHEFFMNLLHSILRQPHLSIKSLLTTLYEHH